MIKSSIVIAFFMLSVQHVLCATPLPWVQRFKFSNNEFLKIKEGDKNYLMLEKKNIAPFSQLLIGFNSIRPLHGELIFFIQVQDALDKKWGKWHKMFQWGDKKQKTFLSESDGRSSFAHVRLELENQYLATGFRVKIDFAKEKYFSFFDSLMITTINKKLFKEEVAPDLNKYCSVVIANIPKISQFCLNHEDNYRICSPASCTMLLNCVMKKNYDPLIIAKSAYDEGLDSYGCWPFNTAVLYEHMNQLYNAYPTRFNSFADVHHQLMQGHPVIVSVRGFINGAPKPYPHGHLLVVIGWDKVSNSVICHDPAALSNDQVLNKYSLVDFQKAWNLSHRLTYLIQRKKANLITQKNFKRSTYG